MNLCQLTATQIIAHLRARDFSATELTRACLDQIERYNPAIHAWIHIAPEIALAQAAAADRKLVAGTGGALCGVPVGLKDIFNTTDMPTQMGSPIWDGFTPGNDARVVYYLRMADAIFPGKTVTAEFAVHAPGPTRNPHHPDHMPGTSSSGSAAAVAANMVPLALGTQTAGSTIRPASYCGIYGLKPSFGLIPRTGMLKTTDTLDTVGFLGRSVDDLELILDVSRVHGMDYPLSHEALNDPARRNKGARPWRVGLVMGPKSEYAEAYARQALEEFGKKLSGIAEIEVESFTLPDSFRQAHAIHATIYDRTLAYYFKEEFTAHTLVSPIMYDIVQRGNKLTLAQYTAALDEQSALAAELDELLANRFDILLDLSTGGEAPVGLYSNDRLDHCLIWTLCGVPTMNLPVFVGPTGLPFGAQIVSRRYNDYMLLSFARYLRNSGLLADGTNPQPNLDTAKIG
jgi:Asp-tRNA(Asn)/Glu-tRNA(Gln) amidotransferase A subunit family amidase